MVPWLLTHHARRRIDEMGLELVEVMQALDDPAVTYPCRPCYERGRIVAVRDRLAVVHNPDARTVITVLWNGGDRRSGVPAIARAA